MAGMGDSLRRRDAGVRRTPGLRVLRLGQSGDG